MKNILNLTLVLVLVAGCSDDKSDKGGDKKANPLNTHQLSQFNQTLDSTYVVKKATQDLKDDQSSSKVGVIEQDRAQVKDTELNQKMEEFKSTMKQNCTFQLTGVDNVKDPFNMDIKFTVGGLNCPVEIVNEHHQKMSADSLSGNSLESYKVLDSELQKTVDLVAGEMTASIKGGQTGVTGTVNGFIQTITQGRIKITGNVRNYGSQNEFISEQTLNWHYSDFTVQLFTQEIFRTNTDGSSSSILNCKLNGTEISEKECRLIQEKMGTETSTEQTQTPEPDSSQKDNVIEI